MKALCWHGIHKVAVDTVPDPTILNPRDAVIKITTTAICGSDLHLYDGFIPAMLPGDILGHEFMGEVVAVGKEVKTVRVGDRILVPFNIACGNCFFCKRTDFAACDNSTPTGSARALETAYGYAGASLFGYSHLYGGYAGGQAEYVRVPYADVAALKIPRSLPDEKVIFLTDIFPTGYMAAENCNIQPGDTIAVWGAGPVGLFALKSATMLGAAKVVTIDFVEGRLRKAAEQCNAVCINSEKEDVLERLEELTGGMGPDGCIDAVGMEAHGTSIQALYDRAKVSLLMATDRPIALRQAIMACRKGGTVSVPGVYGGLLDKFPFGAAFAKGLTFKMGQTHTHRYLKPLLERVERGEIDPSFVITHRYALSDAPKAYQQFLKEKDDCVKVVLKP